MRASGGGANSMGGTLTTGGATSTIGPAITGATANTGGAQAAGGNAATGGAPELGGAPASGGNKASGGTSTTGGNQATGGSLSTGGSKSTGGLTSTGGTKSTGGTPATGGASAGGLSGVAGSSAVPANFFVRYEAESSVNTLTYPVERVANEGTACPTDGVKEGANCSSGGKVVSQILGRSPCDPPTSTTSYTNCQDKGGGVQFNEVTVPADGNYDVTWWYHCGPLVAGGPADVYGDAKCGGLNYNTGTGTGCRPHLIDVNGVPMSSTVGGQTALYYQFPCYTAAWTTVHGATTSLPLKAGLNTIYIHAPGATTLDAADLDAIDVQPNGKGIAPSPLWPKLVTPVVSGY